MFSPRMAIVVIVCALGLNANADDTAIYVGCYDGTILQLDGTGKILGRATIPDTPHNIAIRRNGLLLAVPKDKDGYLAQIGAAGKVSDFYRHATCSHPVGIAVETGTNDVVAIDNKSDVMLHFPDGDPKKVTKIYDFAKSRAHLQTAHIAIGRDRNVILASSGPVGYYRFSLGKKVELGKPVISEQGHVAADSSGNRWVASLEKVVRVYEGSREVCQANIPTGYDTYPPVAFFEGKVLISLRTGNKCEIHALDEVKKTWAKLFELQKPFYVKCLATGPRFSWK